ncbi:S41 family peptidase [Kitasatospora sp. NPDC057198]|uniref:S41 family peptidase n=1 Tax=Kitasatospora sp. NPDC057198 TaxID=3346046 RepID=UPI0036412B0A
MPTNAETVALALDRITAGYVFPERAAEIDRAIRKRLAAGEYDALDGPALCGAVTAHLLEVCPDQHLALRWDDEPQPVLPEDPDKGQAAFLARMRTFNQGVRGFQHLDGNVGYLDVRRIADAAEGARVIGAAMELVAGTSALVLDLRECLGGSPEGCNTWCSYFFPDDQTHLKDIYDRESDTTRQYWTLAHLPAPRYLDRPVYVLTSARTFSGGEDFAYTLQAHRRALVVGETTRGGAHPTGSYQLDAHISVRVPSARGVVIATGTNWEGVGVAPDIAVPAEQALEVAHRDALARTAQPAAPEQ